MISAIGKSGARSAGPTGWPVPGCRTGGGGVGRSEAMLYQVVGIWSSASRYLTVSIAGASSSSYDTVRRDPGATTIARSVEAESKNPPSQLGTRGHKPSAVPPPFAGLSRLGALSGYVTRLAHQIPRALVTVASPAATTSIYDLRFYDLRFAV